MERKKKQNMIFSFLAFRSTKHISTGCQVISRRSPFYTVPLFAQRGLYLTHSDQGAQVLELGAVLRHADAAHGVGLLRSLGGQQPEQQDRRPTFAFFCSASGPYLLLGMVCGPALDMLDEALVEVGGERGREGAGGPGSQGAVGSRG